jgi:alkanesulfonate monooxygenase SsuD/methylene tetrahydromethanopterin reductase-like flavin-dependent oxidoreductase (luciferase family)
MTFRLGICLWTQQAAWPELLRAAEVVDDLGFDHLWTVDHILAPQGEPDQPILESWSVLSAWAARTRRVGLGLFVGANTFHHPAITARLATTLDHISGGRAIVGLGAGWFEREHAAYGLEFGASPGERIGWLDEAAGIVRRLLDGERVTSAGGRYRTEDLRLLPDPVADRVPIMIGGSGERRTLGVVARHADMWNGFGTPETIAHKIAVLRQHCEAVGRDPLEIELTVGTNMVIRRDRASAEAVYAQQLAANHATPETNVTGPAQRWLGTVDEIVARIRAYMEVGAQGLIVEMPVPFDLSTIRALAQDVRPQLA